MEKSINKIAVIGAGVMGSGIAALVANSGYEVVLLDIVAPNSANRNLLVKKALKKIITQKPLALTHPNRLSYITTGNLEEDLELLKDCDLVIEAITENIDLKTALYNNILPYLAPSTILASNTSTLPLHLLKQHIPPTLRARFIITHFFNPPRYMELVELVTDDETNSGVIYKTNDFITHSLGKTIVRCGDTPGFIANRLGCFLLELVVRKAILQELNPAVIDHIFSNLFGLPKTGIFGLYDLIGHDVMYLISQTLLKQLPVNDAYHKIYIEVPLLDNMRSQNILGNKTGKGFYYRKGKEEKNQKVISFYHSSVDEEKIVYESLVIDHKFSNIEELLNNQYDEYSKFFQEILVEFYNYLFNLIPTVTGNINNIEVAIKLGYNWKYGPYELLTDHILQGKSWLKQQGVEVPSNMLNVATRTQEINFEQEAIPVLSNDASSLFSYKGSLVFSIKTKMNLLNQKVFDLLGRAIKYAEAHNKDLILYSNSANFSVGADLKLFIRAIEQNDLDFIDKFLAQAQNLMQHLKYAKINIIACARGFALGGGTELLLHSDFIIAHSELKAGLVEVKLGLLPSFGGMKEMFCRSRDDKNLLINNITNILQYNKSSSADYFFADYAIGEFKIIMNKHDLVSEGLKLKLPPKTVKSSLTDIIHLPKISLKDEIDHSGFNQTQSYLLNRFQEIIEQNSITENELLDLEREYFLVCCKNPYTLEKLKSFVNLKT